MPVTWVVGASGLVGQAVCHAVKRADHDVVRIPVPWMAGTAAQLTALRAGLVQTLDQVGDDSWNVIWVAGAGVVGTTREALDVEAQVFAAFLDDLAAVADGSAAPSALFVASSAGGVYAGSAGAPFTEQSPVAPLAPYGEQKLQLEARTRDFVRRTGVPAMIGRISNVYGPGQNLAKPQGLISQVGKACLLRRPISLYVSLDTTRDYIFVHDCARMIVAGVRALAIAGPAREPVIKIVGSGVPATIATILGAYRRIFRRPPPVVLGDSPNRRFQVRDLRVRSSTWTHLDRYASTPLPAGIGATIADLSARLRSGELSAASS